MRLVDTIIDRAERGAKLPVDDVSPEALAELQAINREYRARLSQRREKTGNGSNEPTIYRDWWQAVFRWCQRHQKRGRGHG